jgi:hypothetical protein
MGDALGATLPFAVGIAASPFPIAAVILVLLGDDARRRGVAFAAGWTCGLLAIGGVMLLIGDASDAAGSDGAESTGSGIVKLLLGAVLLAGAALKWRGRPGPDDEPTMPGWMAAFETAPPARAFALAAALSANPKNLAFLFAATTTIAASAASSAEHAVALVVFILIAALGATAPLAAYVALGPRAPGVLAPVRVWLVRNNAVVIAVMFLIFGATLLGDGIAILA